MACFLNIKNKMLLHVLIAEEEGGGEMQGGGF